MNHNLYLSRFWTRIWAFLIDTFLLAIVGFMIGLIFKSDLISLGSHAKVIGWIISMGYFSILNSTIGNGQTLGKRMLHIQVVDIHGNPISFKKSSLRTFILITPFFLNGYSVPGVSPFSALSVIQIIVVFTCCIGTILFYILNTETRQTIHDVVVKTFVAQDYRNDETTLMPKLAKAPIYALIILFVLSVIFAVYPATKSHPRISRLIPVYEKIMEQEYISSASVFMNYTPLTDSSGDPYYVYTVAIKSKREIQVKNHSLSDNTDIPEIQETARTFINQKSYDSENDVLTIVVHCGFDIGIAKMSNSYNIYKTIREWKRFLND